MPEETTTTTTQTPTGADASSTATAPTGDADKIAAELASLREQIAAKDQILERIKNDEKTERSKRQKAQEENGEHKALAESLKAERDELMAKNAELASRADRAAKLEEGLKGRVEARLGNGLPEYLKIAVQKAPTIAEQIEILDAYDREAGAKASTKTPHTSPGSEGAALQKVDFTALLVGGMTLDEAKAKYPAEWKAQQASITPPAHASSNGFLSSLFGGGKKG